MEIKLINSQFRFSFYKNLFSVKEPDGQLDINELIEVIKYGYLKREITQLRKSKGEEYKHDKMQLPAITTVMLPNFWARCLVKRKPDLLNHMTKQTRGKVSAEFKTKVVVVVMENQKTSVAGFSID